MGRLGGPCGTCRACRQGRFNLCADQPVTGASRDGGYAERMVARASGLAEYSARLTELAMDPPGQDWDGVYEAKSK